MGKQSVHLKLTWSRSKPRKPLNVPFLPGQKLPPGLFIFLICFSSLVAVILLSFAHFDGLFEVTKDGGIP